jgi:hypothetical protein
MWYNLQLIEGLSRQVLSFFYSPNNFFLLFIVRKMISLTSLFTDYIPLYGLVTVADGSRPLVTIFIAVDLLGVYDCHRMGALRFRMGDDEPFLDNQED